MSCARFSAVRFACACFVIAGALCRTRALADRDCAEDLLLSRAAAELLLAHVERPSAETLTRAVRTAGSDAVGLHALFVPASQPAGNERQWLASLRTRVDGELSCGRADGEIGRLLIAVGRGAELAAIDEQARLVRGQLRPGFGDAELVIADADARLVRVGVTAEDLQQGVVLSPELAAPIKVQLVARGPAGPRPVAERELLASASEREQARQPGDNASQLAATNGPATTASPSRPGAALGGNANGPAAAGDTARVSSSSSRESAAVSGAKKLSELLLALRAERGRGALRDNRLLRDAASQHARNVCEKGRVAHEVDAGAGPHARLAQAGLSARLLGEAIARADDTGAALHALENSPSHLYTLLDPRFTDFGVGVAKDSAQKYCYVVLLCAWPRYVGKTKR
jgi:uncharacterized protein YkwD